ncbi:MAG TPA: molybdenum cofactor biosynthesis protein MoaE, partial [Mycobacterium sp.]|nr:molybdenum cofactor biosynthesis protein MoaE [Mycobacterium sp.]
MTRADGAIDNAGAAVLRAALTAEPIVLAEHEALVGHRSAGAIVGFVGAVRDHDLGRQVVRL